MSNKTQLQTNNTTLDGYITRINAAKEVVAELPEGTDAAYEQGKQDEYNNFWDDFQDNGNRRKYGYAFYGKEWNDKTFKPKYDIIIEGTDSHSGFSVFGMAGITDLAKICREQDIIIDGTNYKSGNSQDWFANCYYLTCTPPIPVYDKFKYGYFYGYCKKLHTVEGFYVSENTTFIVNTFNGCTELQNLNIVGTIGQSGLDLHWSTKLTHESLMNIINCLMAYTVANNISLPFEQTVTLMSNARLVEGKTYTVTYYDEDGYGWELQNGLNAICEKMIVNGTETLGIKYESAHPAGTGEEWYIIIYQDGEDIKLTVNESWNFGQNRTLSLKIDQVETHTITLGATNLAKLTDIEKEIATQKGWTLL